MRFTTLLSISLLLAAVVYTVEAASLYFIRISEPPTADKVNQVKDLIARVKGNIMNEFHLGGETIMAVIPDNTVKMFMDNYAVEYIEKDSDVRTFDGNI